jgi:hypothetical protein
VCGLAAFVCTSLIGQAELIGEPWRHYVTVGGVLMTAMAGFMVQHPWDGEERRQDTGPSYFIVKDGLAQRVTRDGFEAVLKESHQQDAPKPLEISHA